MNPYNIVPSSSPGFSTPLQPVHRSPPTTLPIVLPPAILRPVAFRLLTKKHGLTISTTALQLLAAFVGRYCGAGWRDGPAEDVLNHVVKEWHQKYPKEVILDGEAGGHLDVLLSGLGARIKGGRIRSTETVASDEIFGEESDVRGYVAVVGAYEQPRFAYNVNQKHFDRDNTKPSLLPPASKKTQVFRNRYNIIHQRLLRNESFQAPSSETHVPSLQRTSSTFATAQQSYKLTPIANLLGRSGSNHLLLGLLTISPAGTLAIGDLTGSIALDLTHAKTVPEDGAWFVPGMIVLVDGVYEEEDNASGGGLGEAGGIGGAIGGKFIGFTVGGPPCERRQVTLGVTGSNEEGDITAGGGFGWVDFLGLGSEREAGPRMRDIERRVIRTTHQGDEARGRGRVVILGEVTLDDPRTLQALQKLLGLYNAEDEEDIPMSFVFMGNFVQHAVMARGHNSCSIEYKESFDALASILSDFPALLQNSTFVFVPGDKDGWESSFSAGAAIPLPHKQVPEMFRSRIRRAFVTANAELKKTSPKRIDGEAIWTTNPARLCIFGSTHEMVFLRDDISSRFRRTAINFSSSTSHNENEEADIEMGSPVQILQETDNDLHTARKLVKTVLDQGYMSPFPMAKRPIHWAYAAALQLYPIPTALVLADGDSSPFALTYEGCHVMNPGRLVAPGRRGVARWVEYSVASRTGAVREVMF